MVLHPVLPRLAGGALLAWLATVTPFAAPASSGTPVDPPVADIAVVDPAVPMTTDGPTPGTWREQDGLFYLTGQVNGTTIRFLVDTGASVVVLTPEDARRIGVAGRHDGTRIQTASGTAAMRWARLDRVRIGRSEVRDLDAAIVSDGLKVSLLGQNVLTKLGSVTIAGNQLHVR